MKNATRYFNRARLEEDAGNESASLLLYLSSLCDSFNSGIFAYPCGTIAKIQKLQNRLLISDSELLTLVHSYGPLTDADCQLLLSFALNGCLAGIESILSGRAYEH